ncbi:serpin B6-like [Pomacea canaliculata]|uniref:serpin B6-like n=1 Tax=Pomacea canaliculata TaxID=400727 RepID=UPI000D725E96|nr:serpin B6-like [Pomacea canaliculata]
MAELKIFFATSLLVFLVAVVGATTLRHRRATALSLSTSSFGTSLYKRLASGNHNNIVFSPLSVYTALTMTLLGAGGDTERELKTTLGVHQGQDIHAGIHDLMTSITARDVTSNVTVHMADAVYYDAQQVHVTDSYSSRMSQYYGAGLKPFQRPNPEKAINTWVEEVTEGAITNFLQPGAITADTVLMLLNAVYFEVLSSLNARVLELPYKGHRYSFFIILPMAKDGLTHLEGLLNGQNLEDSLSVMPRASHVEILLPKFTLHMRSGLKSHLQALGLKSMFDSSANFTGMARATGGRHLVVSDAQHEAVIEVTETGTKAAAVTSIQIVAESEPTMFKVDHPCLFILRDKTDGVNLFMGRLTDPSQSH